MIVVGSLIATFYDSEPMSGNQVMNIGAAAPAIIAALAAEPRDPEGETRKFDGSTPLQSRLRHFLAFG
ncbi:hypothetical protein [Microvirga sp. VF16]|uniref:hypothetical protein n=1 Tax=Microvirga sp. VF16 TaxID=2807101 RepID=UPI00193CD1C2|nr:hypothetical protein [Microvirga sp. VF16]QRM33726.1 hypothetical protein JO965_37670 [Microvirga sp. VF16]